MTSEKFNRIYEDLKKMKKFEIRSAFSPREPVNVPLSGAPSRTKQEFKKEVNINEIMRRLRAGINPPQWMTSNTPRYGDFTNLPVSFQEAYAIMQAGEEAFASLPLEFRRAIDHDPRNLDKAPRELYEKFGLLKKPVDPPSADPKGHASSAVDPVFNEPTGSKKAAKKAADNADD